MITTRVVSETGSHPDIAWGSDGSPIVVFTLDGSVVLRWLSEMPSSSTQVIHCNGHQNPFPRIVRRQHLDDIWLAYRAVRHGRACIILRDVPSYALGAVLGEERVAGRCSRQDHYPVCVSPDGWIAWQDSYRGEVLGIFGGIPPLVNGMPDPDCYACAIPLGPKDDRWLPVPRSLRQTIHPGGLSRIFGHWPVFAHEDKFVEPSLVSPVYADGCVVGVGESGQLIAELYDGPPVVVLDGPCQSPRLAHRVDGTYAAVTWGQGVGVLMVTFTADDLRQAST